MNYHRFANLRCVVALLILLTGCVPANTHIVTQLPAQAEPTALPPPQPTATEEPTPAPVEMPAGPGAAWNLVVIGDSSMWEHGKAIAVQINKDLGVQVVLHDFALPTLRASSMLEALKTGKSPNARLEQLPKAVKEAQMIVMFANPLGSINPEKTLDLDGCFAVSPPKACDMEAFDQYSVDLKDIWGEIIKLRAGQPTILRATDIYNPLVDTWIQNNIFDSCNICWENQSLANRQAAETYNIPFLSRYDSFNGLDHREDPKVKGYIREDGEHPTEKGGEYFAKLLSAMGYEPTIP